MFYICDLKYVLNRRSARNKKYTTKKVSCMWEAILTRHCDATLGRSKFKYDSNRWFIPELHVYCTYIYSYTWFIAVSTRSLQTRNSHGTAQVRGLNLCIIKAVVSELCAWCLAVHSTCVGAAVLILATRVALLCSVCLPESLTGTEVNASRELYIITLRLLVNEGYSRVRSGIGLVRRANVRQRRNPVWIGCFMIVGHPQYRTRDLVISGNSNVQGCAT